MTVQHDPALMSQTMATLTKKRGNGLPDEVKSYILNQVLDERQLATEFLTTYFDREDDDHWYAFDMQMTGASLRGLTEPELDYFIHMLNAFAAGERFIVAKLAYGGGEA